MRAPLPMARTMLRTAAACTGVGRRGGADTRESKYVAGADDTAPGGLAPRWAACPALAVAVPVVPAIAAAARLMPTGITNRRLRMLPPVVGKDRPAARREPRCGGSAPPHYHAIATPFPLRCQAGDFSGAR